MNQQSHRKNEHVSLAEKFYSEIDNQFKGVRLIHSSFPEIKASEVDPSTAIENGKVKFKWPFYIEAMTGGSPQTQKLNNRLSEIAQETGIGMACGSQSVAVANPQTAPSFQIIRKNLTTGPVIANMGANHDYQAVQQAIDMLNADAVEIHVNVIQEMIMPEGDRNFYWLQNIKEIQQKVSVPVIVKEVGFGMDKKTIQDLIKCNINNINVSGRGGTNFAKIENYRRNRQELQELSELGQSTVESLLEGQDNKNNVNLIASGGVKSALDVVKAIALGAKVVGVAGWILNSLIKNDDETTIQHIKDWQNEIITLMTILGCKNIEELRRTPLLFSSELMNYIKQRKISVL